MQVDNTDLKIISILQKNGRITNSSLASEVKLSTAATLERVRKLEIKGVIAGYYSTINAKKLGLNCEFIAGVTLRGLTKNNITGFCKLINKVSYISSCEQIIGGRYHFFIRGVTDSLESYHDKVVVAINDFGMIESMDHFIVLGQVKNEGYSLDGVVVL